jgi:hypothetical protein
LDQKIVDIGWVYINKNEDEIIDSMDKNANYVDNNTHSQINLYM